MRDVLSRYTPRGQLGVEGGLSETRMDVIVALARFQEACGVSSPYGRPRFFFIGFRNEAGMA